MKDDGPVPSKLRASPTSPAIILDAAQISDRPGWDVTATLAGACKKDRWFIQVWEYRTATNVWHKLTINHRLYSDGYEMSIQEGDAMHGRWVPRTETAWVSNVCRPARILGPKDSVESLYQTSILIDPLPASDGVQEIL